MYIYIFNILMTNYERKKKQICFNYKDILFSKFYQYLSQADEFRNAKIYSSFTFKRINEKVLTVSFKIKSRNIHLCILNNK